MAALTRQRWPGNVRELRNMVERTVAIGSMPAQEQEGAPRPAINIDVDATMPFKVAKALLMERYTEPYLRELMRLNGGNVSKAARAAELDRVYLIRLLRQYGFRPTPS
jgi:DNA-binding NtrC family response regulator